MSIPLELGGPVRPEFGVMPEFGVPALSISPLPAPPGLVKLNNIINQ